MAKTIKSKRPQTPNRGAADIISQVIRKVRRLRTVIESPAENDAVYINSATLIQWLRDWDLRAAKRKGGLGK